MDNLIYSLMEDTQFVDIMTADILDEGSYSEAIKFGSTELAKEYDSHLAAGKKAKKDKDYKLAIKEFNECKKLIPKINAAADKIPDDNGWDKFLGILSTTGVSLMKKYKDEKTGNRAYYRKWWKEWVQGAIQFLDKEIADCKSKI